MRVKSIFLECFLFSLMQNKTNENSNNFLHVASKWDFTIVFSLTIIWLFSINQFLRSIKWCNKTKLCWSSLIYNPEKDKVDKQVVQKVNVSSSNRYILKLRRKNSLKISQCANRSSLLLHSSNELLSLISGQIFDFNIVLNVWHGLVFIRLVDFDVQIVCTATSSYISPSKYMATNHSQLSSKTKL